MVVCYRGGVVAIVGVIVVVAVTGDFEIGAGTFETLVRFATICIFFRRAARRARMLCTTVTGLLAQEIFKIR